LPSAGRQPEADFAAWARQEAQTAPALAPAKQGLKLLAAARSARRQIQRKTQLP